MPTCLLLMEGWVRAALCSCSEGLLLQRGRSLRDHVCLQSATSSEWTRSWYSYKSNPQVSSGRAKLCSRQMKGYHLKPASDFILLFSSPFLQNPTSWTVSHQYLFSILFPECFHVLRSLKESSSRKLRFHFPLCNEAVLLADFIWQHPGIHCNAGEVAASLGKDVTLSVSVGLPVAAAANV